ncbi:MAG: hypothetical protein HOP15_17605 [Planctomycetes bacterium]|nr:hypothetical protein [Planctomycetota bacterium]
MPYELQPGYAFGCNINAHRSNWSGVICKAAASWNCGARQEFREDYCESGDPRCYHIHAFDEAGPSIVIDDNGGSWLFGSEPEAFDDQLLLLWGSHAVEPRGVREPPTAVLFGAYRVRQVEARTRSSYTEWVVRPHASGWTRFTKLRIPVPRWEGLQGPYLKQVDRSAVERVFERALELAEESMAPADEAPELERLQSFVRELPGWLDHAAKKTQKLRARRPGLLVASAAPASPSMTNRPLKGIGNMIRTLEKPADARLSALPARSALAPVPEVQVVPVALQNPVEETVHARIAARHGEAVLTAVLVGLMTKPLLILRGSPGVGKSDLAGSLIDDPNRERMLTVVVDPTWRGREDLLGHVNPIDTQFEPTAATNFLRRAAQAWEKGDRRAHILIFEEFNLSQPEHWLSEILVRSQYAENARFERTIELGGTGVRGWSGHDAPRLFLSPALRMVATINSDHTVRALSPRVLDRAAVIELSIQPHEALRRVGLELEKQELDAIADLDFKLRQRGAVFSYRTAESLKACLGRLAEVHLDRTRALDLVLVQEVLSKVRLLAADPADVRLCDELVEWTESDGKGLLACQRVIAGWREALQSSQDVQQA